MSTALRLGALAAALLVALGGQAARAGPEEAAWTRIAFGSCLHQDKPQPILETVLAWRPDLLVFAGDNVYGDVTSGEMRELKAAYDKAAASPGLARLRAAQPVLSVWDDHDYGRNDGGGDFPFKATSQRLFLDFWGVPEEDPRRRRPGIYTSAIHGPEGRRVQVILLDTRSFRSPLRPTDRPGAPGRERYLPDPDPAATMLGEAQWRWLEEELRRPAELRLIVSSVQVLADGHGFERWGNLPAERRRLLGLVSRTGAGGVLFLSGDRHIGALYRLDEEVPYPLHEITSSGLNMIWAASREAGPHQQGPVYAAENFGTVEVDWQVRELRLALRGMDGGIVREARISLDILEAR
ncbi:alkaline phosphatase D family protein [Geminicoccaceae bacterium 1502E]|nr:alkaline phosphatase D family protein [Geminicoccaceae bacterium 1502E]